MHTDREDHASQNHGKEEAVARREGGKQLYSNTKLTPLLRPHLLSRPPPLPALGTEPASTGQGQMADGPQRLYSWTRAEPTQ